MVLHTGVIFKGSSVKQSLIPCWIWLYFSSTSTSTSSSPAKNSCSDWTVQSVFAKIGNLVEGYAKRWWCEARDNWPNGGAMALDWKCKLWTHVADEPYVRQRWHLYPLMRLLVPNNFRIQMFDLWCLDQLLFLIEFFFSFSTSFCHFWLNRAVTFCETREYGRGLCQEVTMRSPWSLAKGWRYGTRLKIKYPILLTLNTRSSWTVWLSTMTLTYTDASPHAEQLLYSDFWPLMFRSAAILYYLINS